MQCPICSEDLLEEVLEPGLYASICEKHGKWLPAVNYWKWIATQHISYPPKIEPGEFDEVSTMDRHGEKLCSECGIYLARYSIGHGIHFHIDQCPQCAGIWLDSGEWEVLKKKNLHNAIHFMFSESWQLRVGRENQKEDLDEIMYEKLGYELYTKVTSLRSKLIDHNMRDVVIAYLTNS